MCLCVYIYVKYVIEGVLSIHTHILIIYVYVYVYIYICIYVCTSTDMYVYVNKYMYILNMSLKGFYQWGYPKIINVDRFYIINHPF